MCVALISLLYYYRKTSIRSRVPVRSRGSKTFVQIEARSRIHAGSRLEAGSVHSWIQRANLQHWKLVLASATFKPPLLTLWLLTWRRTHIVDLPVDSVLPGNLAQQGLKKITKRTRKFAATSGGSRNFWWRCTTRVSKTSGVSPRLTSTKSKRKKSVSLQNRPLPPCRRRVLHLPLTWNWTCQ